MAVTGVHALFHTPQPEALRTVLRDRGIEFRGEPQTAGFGVTITMVLPGDVELTLYQPRHVTAI